MTHFRLWPTTRGARIVAGASLCLALAALVALVASLGSRRPLPPLANVAASPDALSQAVLAAFQEGDIDSLRALALTEAEFRVHVWPELPASQPDRNVPFEFAWGMLQQTSEGYLRQLVAQFEGSHFTLVRVEFGGTTTVYNDVIVHRDTRLIVRSPDGRERTLRLFGSTIEQDGRYKVFSFVAED